jgi:hypothetical protein
MFLAQQVLGAAAVQRRVQQLMEHLQLVLLLGQLVPIHHPISDQGGVAPTILRVEPAHNMAVVVQGVIEMEEIKLAVQVQQERCF